MKHIVVGDLHGKNCWKQIDVSAYDRVVFLGDYVDHWTHTNTEILSNLEEIIAFKRQYPDKVILLLGNHDVQYLYFPYFRCTGFRPLMQPDLTDLFHRNRELFQVAYQQGNHLFTHAGVTNDWYDDLLSLLATSRLKISTDRIADLLNKVDQTASRSILHTVGEERGGIGNGGITWADKKETTADMLTGYHQVVGHTPVPHVETIGNKDSSVTYVDVLQTTTYFYEIVC